MTLLLLATRATVHEEALAAAAMIGAAAPLHADRLNAPVLDAARGWVERLWDTAQGALDAAWEAGAEAAGALVERFGEELGELRAELAEGAAAVIETICERLAEYARSVTRRLLRQFEAELAIGERRFAVKGITVQQRVKMTGSLKASLKELCAMVSEGEVSVSATYGT
jgi:hypothetical protein